MNRPLWSWPTRARGVNCQLVAITAACWLLAMTGAARAFVDANFDTSPAPDTFDFPGDGTVPDAVTIGVTSFGELAVNSGSTLTLQSDLTLGGDSPAGFLSYGDLTVSGVDADGVSTLNIEGLTTFGNSGGARVEVNGSANINILGARPVLANLESASAQVRIRDPGSLLETDRLDPMIIGNRGLAFVEIFGGGLMHTAGAELGSNRAGSGSVTVDGLTSKWDNTAGGNLGTLAVGLEGQGFVRVQNSGSAFSNTAVVGQAAGSLGSVIIEGFGSRWQINSNLTVASEGVGTVSIQDSGRLLTFTENAALIGDAITGVGRIEVVGAGSLWSHGPAPGSTTPQNIVVGNEGIGYVDVLDGAQALTHGVDLAVGGTSYGAVTVDGAASRWIIQTGALNISADAPTLGGAAEFTVSNSGLAYVQAGGVSVGTLGTLTLAGGRLQAGSISAPQQVSNAGLVRGGGRIDATLLNSATGQVRVNLDEHLVVSGLVTNSPGGLVDIQRGEFEALANATNGGDIHILDGIARFRGPAGLTNSAGAQLAATGGLVDVYGAVTNAGQIAALGQSTLTFHDTVSSTGQLAVSAGTTVDFLGNLNLANTSSLEVQFSGLDVTSPVVVAGQAGLVSGNGNPGTLTVLLAGGFNPVAGDSFTVLTAANGVSLGSCFANPASTGLANGMVANWGVRCNANDVIVTVTSLTAGRPGDFDFDGDFDVLDIDGLVAAIVVGDHNPAYDLTNDGQVTVSDRDAWLDLAAIENLGPGRSYLLGDANLSGAVDGSDFNAWNAHKFTTSPAWSHGDFNATGGVDGSDFALWNAHKFQSSDGFSAVPEPGFVGCLFAAIGLLWGRRIAGRTRVN